MSSPEQRNKTQLYKMSETPRSLIKTLSSHHKEGDSLYSDSPRSLIKTLASHHKEFQLDLPKDLEDAHLKSTNDQSI